jgi:hypothetical protein
MVSGAAKTEFDALKEQTFRIEFLQPIQGERWPGSVAQQPLAPGAVGGLDGHRAVDGEAAAMLPLPRRPRVIGWQPGTARENAQQPPAHACLHVGDGVGIELGGGPEDDPARGGGVEHAVDYDTVKVQMQIATS